MHFPLSNCFLFIVAVQFLFTLTRGEGKQWALLVAGSKSWINYRHQADLCHAYQLLREQGIPEANIITMMYDDIANHKLNPDKGVIINRPGGPNVYKGVVKDYTGDDLNVQNMLNVLKGDKNAMKGIGSGRVIESGPEDTIFINIVDHGGPGTITINNEYLYADQLNSALRYLKKENKFNKILMYVETCESGSMFDAIIDDQSSVFVMTAAAPDESSFIRYYSDKLNTYIGDAFSTIWMEHVDKLIGSDTPVLTSLFKQYKYVRTNVNSSHVMIYGDFRLGFDHISNYMGANSLINSKVLPKEISLEKLQSVSGQEEWIPSEEVQISLFDKQLSKSKSIFERQSIKMQRKQIEEGRSIVDGLIEEFLKKVAASDVKLYLKLSKTKSSPKEVFPCYREIIRNFNEQCFKTNQYTYVTRHFHKLINVCLYADPSRIDEALKAVCPESIKQKLAKQLLL